MRSKYIAAVIAVVMIAQMFTISAFADTVVPKNEVILSETVNKITSFGGLTEGVTTGAVDSGKLVFTSTHSDGWKLFEAYLDNPVSLSAEELEYASLDFDIQTQVASGSNAPWHFQFSVKDTDGNNTGVYLSDYGAVSGSAHVTVSIPLKNFGNVSPTVGYFAIQINDWSGVTITISNMSVNVCPSSISVLSQTQETQIIGWDAVPGASSYYVFRNGYFIGETVNTYAESKGLLAESTYDYRVSAKIDGTDIFCTPTVSFKTPTTLTESYEIPFFKSGMKGIEGIQNIQYSLWGNGYLYTNDQYYDGIYETGRPFRVVSWGWPDYSQLVFSESKDTSDSDKYNNTALSFMAMNAGQGKNGDMGFYFFTGEGMDPGFYSSFSVNMPPDGKWYRYDIPLSSIELNNGFRSMLIGGSNTELVMDNIRFTSINPEIVTVMFYDENDSVVLPEDGVYENIIKKCRVRFNREINADTISGVDVKVNGSSIVEARTYDEKYCEVTMTLGDIAAGNTLTVSTADTVLSVPAIGSGLTNGGSTGTTENAGAQPAIEASYDFSIKPEKVNYYKVTNDSGIDIAPTILFPMTVKAEMEKGIDNCGDMMLILAVYDSDTRLKKLVTKTVLSSDLKGVYKTENVDVVRGDKVKVFIFDSPDNIVPIVPAK